MLARLATQTGILPRGLRARQLFWCVLGVLAGAPGVAFAANPAAVQAPAPQTSSASTTNSPHTAVPSHRRVKPKPAAVAPPQAAYTPPIPVTPPPPNWPANDKPVDATVMWDSKGLSIVAANSSLQQILNQVATETGAKVDGMNADQRVFGSYGPGPARDVIGQLLDGSGYNVLMIGGEGSGAPRQILLSSRPTGPAPMSNSNNQAEEEVEAEPPPPPEPQPMPMPMQNPEPPNRGVIQPQLQGPFGTRPFPGQVQGQPQGQDQNQPNGNQPQ
jgi:hypothetical protein